MGVFEDFAKKLAEFEKNEAEITKTSPDRLVLKEYLRRDISQLRIRPTYIVGNKFYAVKFWNKKFGIPYLKTLGYSLDPSGGKIVQDVSTGKGLLWNAWDVRGRQRYIEGEPVFYGVGSAIRDNKTAKEVWI